MTINPELDAHMYGATELGQSDLLPCPFCGGQLTRTLSDAPSGIRDPFYEHLGAEGCILRVLTFLDRPEQVAAWNRRASLSCIEAGPGGVTDAQVEAALNAWWGGNWPDMVPGDIAGMEADMRAALKAAALSAIGGEAEPVAKRLIADDVEWVVNDLAELGVKIGDQFFFCYKGYSLVYGALDDDPTLPPFHDETDPTVGYAQGDRMKWRHVNKREFGECIHPINYGDLTRIGTVDLNDGLDWHDIPPARPQQGEAK